jgi:hypothetical protein
VVELDALGFKIRFAEFLAFGAEITLACTSAGLAFYEVANETIGVLSYSLMISCTTVPQATTSDALRQIDPQV